MRQLICLIMGVCLIVGAFSTVWSAPEESATIKLTDDDVKLEVTFKDGGKMLLTDKPQKIKPGTHLVKSLRLFKKDEKGRVWELRCAKQLSTLGTITVAPRQSKIIDTGKKPIHFDYFIWPNTRSGTLHVLFRFTARGGYGEVYYPGAFRGRKRPPMPAYRITDENGKILAEGRLEHNAESDVGLYSWPVPKGLTGNCKIEIKPTMGPFDWEPPSKQFNPQPRQKR